MNGNLDIVETAKHAGNFRIFLQALEATGLRAALEETGPYTIVAPVDDAFVKIPQTKLHDLFRRDNREPLGSLLKNHIIPGNLPSKDLKTHDELRSVTGEQLRIESRAGLWVNEAQVIAPDLKASNGVLHGIDTVLLPESDAATAG